ncbi:hypothetical protein BURC_02151 [Burkholderiaceae bacterium]|nr:hypothetical protein BURC_02151 [Burkholderiaceae bacterium]
MGGGATAAHAVPGSNGEVKVQYAYAQARPAKWSVGFIVVALLHVVVVYALVGGLARKVVDVIKQPLETKIIEAVKPPQEMAPPPIAPPPRLDAPPPPFIPPPEVQIQAPPPASPVIAAVTATPPPAAPMTPVAPPIVAPPPGPVNVRTVCTRMPQPELPAVEVTGTVSMLAKLTIVGGRVRAVEVSQFRGASDRRSQRLLAGAVEAAARQYHCSGDVVAVQEFVFNIN